MNNTASANRKSNESNEAKAWAAFLLVLAGIGFVVFFPCREAFWGGLMTSFFSAALVGGLADWFAVVSIFERPFGLPFLRAVIPDRKEKLIEDLSVMISSELLAEKNIKDALLKHDLTKSLKLLVDSQDTKNVIAKLLHDLLLYTLKNQKSYLEKIVHDFVFDQLLPNLQKSPTTIIPIIQGIIKWSDARGYLDKVWCYLIGQTLVFVNSPSFHSKIEKSLPVFIGNYLESAKIQYKLGEYIIKSLPLPWAWETLLNSQLFKNAVASKFQQIISNNLEKYLDSDLMPKKQKTLILNAADNLAQNEYLLSQLGTIQEKIKADPKALHEYFERIFKQVEYQLVTNTGFVVERINDLSIIICRMISEQLDDMDKQAVVRDRVNTFLLELIGQHRDKLPSLVTDRFHSFSDGELESDMRAAVGDDLQYIRITGTIIGGATGVGIFLINNVFSVFAGR